MRKNASLAALALAAALLAGGCSERPEWIKTFFTLEGRADKMDLPPTTPDELKKAVAEYRKIVEEKVEAGSKAAYYQRLLGSAYLDKRMYGEALEAFTEAARLTPANAPLFYYMGLCSGYVGKSLTAPGEAAKSREYILAAERNYLRALDLDPVNDRSLYALSVLYAFELGRPADAVPLAERYLAINTEDDAGRFVLARSYYLTGRTADAEAVYETIAKKSKNPTAREDAERNLDAIRNQGAGR